MFKIIADPIESFVRETRTIGKGFVVLLESESKLRNAATSSFFSGNGTYKSVTGDVRYPIEKEWHLYNNVALENNHQYEATEPKRIVVRLFLTSRLAVDTYRAV